eukprot:CAMPEP_0197052230 /NCGR_PEP_ID=MMETSP1384-20130603/26736_1 /TAXON_ID=29189 /ORGANISM="Ammonia sp." /LENGTH=403 /DNA_ID=CAMNT_0042484903 /DNA_START=42 /DNA_END=1253 /DNA_ORIENTATION=-
MSDIRKRKTNAMKGKTAGSGSNATDDPQSKSKDKQSDEQYKAQLQDMSNFTKFLPTVIMGMIFGFVLNKGRVFEPGIIVDQFLFKRWVMMKMFLSAAASSTLCLSLMQLVSPREYKITRAKCAVYNLFGSVVGGAILGAGMAIGGICPGMVLAQIGAGVPNSVLCMASILGGAFIYGLIEPFIRSWTTAKTLKYGFFDEMFPHRNVLALGFAAAMLSVVALLETLVPWKTELTTSLQPGCNWITCKAWPPYVAGAIVGALQIPSVALLGNPIGSSTAYVCVMSQWLRFFPQSTHDFFALFKGKLGAFWQVVYIASAVLGSMMAVQFSGTMEATDVFKRSYDGIQGNEPWRVIVGGCLVIFGARFAKGCTSGHGISGMGVLSTASMIVVAAMFAGGAIAALLTK